MRLFRDKELEARLIMVEEELDQMYCKLDNILEALSTKEPKKELTTEEEDKARIERMDKSFQKLMNYNEDIAVKGYRK